ncbi:MAG: hypothetical protein ACOVO1_09890 [Chitinophagaceae bacterium]
MKFKQIFIIAIAAFLFSCKNKKNIPDVSAIKVDLKIERFESDFFKMDTENIAKSLDLLNQKYPSFLKDYLYQVLGLMPQPDSVISQTRLFLEDSLYRTIYQDATKKFSSLDNVKAELTLGLQLTKHYFPQYNLPKKLITFVGPLDGVGTALTSDHSLAIGLQGYLGKDYEAYQNGYIAQTYPAYKSRRFEPQYIATNCVKNIIEEIFPDKSNGRPLAERMVEQGRRLYVLDMLLPKTADSVKTGYTQSQLTQCFDNEKTIWAFFVQGNLLFEREPSIASPYVTDGPKTQELSETAPGNIGTFIGWQIVKKWMDAHPKTSLETLMQTPTMTIFNDAGYKP